MTTTSKQVTHTPGPWKAVIAPAIQDGEIVGNITTEDGELIAVTTEANAAHIVRCVNEREELIQAVSEQVNFAAENIAALTIAATVCESNGHQHTAKTLTDIAESLRIVQKISKQALRNAEQR